jgi:WD40 repeat protein
MLRLASVVLLTVLGRSAAAAPCIEAGKVADDTKEIYAVAFVDPATLAVAGTKPEIQLYSLDGKRKGGLAGHIEGVRALTLDPKGRVLSASCDESVFVWSAGRPKPVQRLVGRHLAIHEKNLDDKKWTHQGCVTQVVASPDGAHLITGSNDHHVRVFDAGKLAKLADREYDDYVASIAYDPATGTVVSAAFTGKIDLGQWRTNTHRRLEIDTSKASGWRRAAVVITKDKTWLVTGSPDGVLRRWDLAGDKPDATLDTKGGQIGALAIHPKLPVVAAGLNSGEVVVWDVAKNVELARYRAHTSMIVALAWSADGKHLASSHFEKGPVSLYRCTL